jgi:hypothetical protein
MPSVRPACSLRLAASLVLALVLTACGPGGPSRFDLAARTEKPNPRAIVFLVDGMPPRLVEAGCAEGWLPNIERYVRGRGTRVEHAVTAVPSITYAAIATLKTGVEPARHGILGNHWFDPQECFFRDYCQIGTYAVVDQDYDAPTIYERADPAPTATVQTVHRRGADYLVRNWALSGTMWFFRNYTAVDKLSVTSFWRIIWWANAIERWPKIVTFYFPGVDSIGHAYGPDSGQFRDSIVHADHQIGRVAEWLERQGMLERTYLVVVSDHGMSDAGSAGRIDLAAPLRDAYGRNLTTRCLQTANESARRRYFAQYDTVLDALDGRRASIHFRGSDDWQTPPREDEVERILLAPEPSDRLWQVPGVLLVAYRADAETVVLRSAAGVSTIRGERRADGWHYTYDPGDGDVLGYNGDAELAEFLAGGPQPDRAWLAVTADQEYPDIVPRLLPLLHQPRAGQVLVFPRRGYSFIAERGGHGSLHRDEMLMSLYIAGPGVPAGAVLPCARGSDLAPTLLELLQIPYDAAEFDGRSLVADGLYSAKLDTQP